MKHQGHARLFPELRDDSGKGFHSSVSRRFNRRLERLGIVDRRGRASRKVLYSLRHNVIDALKEADVPAHVIAQLVGHKDDTMTTGRYGSALKPAKLREAVERLDFSAALEALPIGPA